MNQSQNNLIRAERADYSNNGVEKAPERDIARRVCTMVSRHAIETEIQVCLCRDKLDAPFAVLKPNSIVVVGGRKRFWRTEETRMADSIRRQGHQVVFIDQDGVASTHSYRASAACDKIAAS